MPVFLDGRTYSLSCQIKKFHVGNKEELVTAASPLDELRETCRGKPLTREGCVRAVANVDGDLLLACRMQSGRAWVGRERDLASRTFETHCVLLVMSGRQQTSAREETLGVSYFTAPSPAPVLGGRNRAYCSASCNPTRVRQEPQ